jgi:hypothetical protein
VADLGPAHDGQHGAGVSTDDNHLVAGVCLRDGEHGDVSLHAGKRISAHCMDDSHPAAPDA